MMFSARKFQQMKITKQDHRQIITAALLAAPLLAFPLVPLWATQEGPPAEVGPLPGLHDPREKHLANVKQLTSGGQNAEAYWSYDSKRLIYQYTGPHEGGEIKADQMFVMNADGTEKKRVSNGQGRCTCGYFLKGDKEIIYASTHGYSAHIPPEPDRSQGYVWPIYPYYAIFKAKADGTGAVPLFPPNATPGTQTGYNAEATVSPDGKRIIFTSTRNGDLDLYSMNTDGSDVKRLTFTVGYDGGAFFSPNGRQIVWRAYYPQDPKELEEYKSLLKRNLVRPSKMEIWVANADGTDGKQVTKNGAANFAPFFTPDGKKIIFASNMDDPRRRRFELYLINPDGTGLERVTYGREFDSFPMFSPDGKKLVWASNRNGKNRETNIFVADWMP
jgi:Tol biopolymer transport system component